MAAPPKLAPAVRSRGTPRVARAVGRRRSSRPPRQRTRDPTDPRPGACRGAGLLLTAAGLISPLATTDITQVAGARLGLAVGVLVLGYAIRLRRHLAQKEREAGGGGLRAWAAGWAWALVFLIATICLFVAADDYGSATGTSNAPSSSQTCGTTPMSRSTVREV